METLLGIFLLGVSVGVLLAMLFIETELRKEKRLRAQIKRHRAELFKAENALMKLEEQTLEDI